MSRNLPTEAFLVGIISVILFCMVHSTMKTVSHSFSISQLGMLIGTFIAGMLAHVAMEKTGVNKELCKTN